MADPGNVHALIRNEEVRGSIPLNSTTALGNFSGFGHRVRAIPVTYGAAPEGEPRTLRYIVPTTSPQDEQVHTIG